MVGKNKIKGPFTIEPNLNFIAFKAEDMHKIDARIGAKIKRRRTLLGVSQSELGKALGLTFQQVQKYEKGVSHIAASRLWEIAKILEVPIAFFLDDLENKPTQGNRFSSSPMFLAEQRDEYICDPWERKDVRELVKAYCSIQEASVAKNVVKIVKDLAKIQNEKSSESSTDE